MFSVTAQWNPKQALLKEIIQKNQFEQALALCLDMHALVHSSTVSESLSKTYEDELWDSLDDEAFRIMPTPRDVTIAWDIWHITRIEDITANILLGDTVQVLNSDNWLERMNAGVRDTGNAMTDGEILQLSRAISMEELKSYRRAVGGKTREILRSLKPGSLNQKFKRTQLDRIFDEGGVLRCEGSQWLVDFWGRKTVGGILLMPITRHQIVHIHDALKLKETIRKQKSKQLKGSSNEKRG